MKRILVTKKIPKWMSQYSQVEPELKAEVLKHLSEVSEISLSGPDYGMVTVKLELYAMSPSKATAFLEYIEKIEDKRISKQLKEILYAEM